MSGSGGEIDEQVRFRHLVRLPVDDVVPDVLAALAIGNAVVLQAPPGAGKTTRVPPALLDAGLLGKVVVLEPRRLAAQLSARRVASERGERVGDTVGYDIRFDRAVSASTRLEFVTEGIFARRLLSDPELRGVGAVVLDEFHERHLQADVALAMLRRLQRGARPDLKLVVMSATLDALPVAAFLGAPVLTSTGRTFDVAVTYATEVDARPLEAQVASAVRALLDEPASGDVLVFLPGAAEIRRCLARCQALAERFDIALLPLHGDLSSDAQEEALRPQTRRKVIFSTNVAETSVTIEGVTAVIDSGLARVAKHDPWSGRPSLEVAKISRASATQRAGRAGRLAPGRALRLYTKGDHDTRAEHDTPEIQRADLAETALMLRALADRDAAPIAWLDAPPELAMRGAEQLLVRLGALDAVGAITDVGRSMLRLPLPPRLGKVVVEAVRRGVRHEGCRIAAMLAEGRDVFRARSWDGPATSVQPLDGPSDLTARLAAVEEATFGGFDAALARQLGLDVEAVRAVEKVAAQLLRASERDGQTRGPAKLAAAPVEEAERYDAVQRAVLAGFPDRVARRRADGDARLGVRRELLLSSGGTAVLAESSVVRTAPWLVAVEAGDRAAPSMGTGPGAAYRGKRQTHVWLASAIEPDWLIDLYPGAVQETIEVTWSGARERVEAVERLMYDRLTIDEGVAGAAADPPAAALLAEKVLAAGLGAFVDEGMYGSFIARLRLLVAEAPELAARAGLQAPDDAWLRDLLLARLAGKRSFAELRDTPLWEEFKTAVGHAALAHLDALCPTHVPVGAGRRAVVHYELDQRPWIESRLQDFFGSREGPKIVAGRVPLVVHMLAPNGRAVQVTSDIAGFWARTYAEVRRELMRRYPRHAWPADPLSAVPPPRAPRRAP